MSELAVPSIAKGWALVSAPTFQPGDRVTIGKNDARVEPGSRGVVIGLVSETGLPLVDVEGRGRVSFTPDSLELINRVLDEPAPKKKRTMSPEARARIAEAQRERHRLLREATEQAPATSPAAVVHSDDGDAATIRRALAVAARHGLGATTLVDLAQLLASLESAA